MKNKKAFIFIVVLVLVVASIVGAILTWVNCWQRFWSITIGELITIFIAVFIAYIASTFKDNENRIKSYVEQELNRLRHIADENVLYNLPTIGKANYQKEINLFFTRADNVIAAIEKKKDEFKYVEEIKYISNECKELHEFVSEKIEDFDYLCNSVTVYKKHLNKISDKALEIIFLLYK